MVTDPFHIQITEATEAVIEGHRRRKLLGLDARFQNYSAAFTHNSRRCQDGVKQREKMGWSGFRRCILGSACQLRGISGPREALRVHCRSMCLFVPSNISMYGFPRLLIRLGTWIRGKHTADGTRLIPPLRQRYLTYMHIRIPTGHSYLTVLCPEDITAGPNGTIGVSHGSKVCSRRQIPGPD